MKKKQVLLVLVVLLLFGVVSQIDQINVNAKFQKGTIENIEDWFTSSSLVNFSQDYKINLFFSIANDTLGYAFAPRLSFHTRMNLPLNFTSYLNNNIQEGFTEFGLQIGSSTGNFTFGLNGTIIIVTPQTGPVYINVTEGEVETYANFDTFLGENITIPINFNPVSFEVNDLNIPEHPEIQSVGIKLSPSFILEGTVKLKADVLGETLTWTNPEDIFFTEVPVDDESTFFSTLIANITLDFNNLRLSLTGLDAEIFYDTSIGTIIQKIVFDLGSIEWIEGQQALGDVFIFLVDSFFVMSDIEIYVLIEKSSFSLLAILAAIAILSGLIYLRRKV